MIQQYIKKLPPIYRNLADYIPIHTDDEEQHHYIELFIRESKPRE